MKAQWRKPTLVILSRGNPEEMVLTCCKSVSGPAKLPVNGKQKCDARRPHTQDCDACQPECGGQS